MEEVSEVMKHNASFYLMLIIEAVMLLTIAVLPWHTVRNVSGIRFRNDPEAAFSESVYLDDTIPAMQLESEQVFLKRGIYHITLDYMSNSFGDNDITATVISADDMSEMQSAHLVDSDRVPLFGEYSRREWTIMVHNNTNVRILVNLNVKDHSYYTIVSSAEIRYDARKTDLHELSKYIFIFLLLDTVLWILIFRRNAFSGFFMSHAFEVICLSGIWVLAFYIFLTNEFPYGVDLPYHMKRIRYLAEGLAAGPWPVRIQPGWTNGYGYAASIGYPDLFLIPASLLVLLGYSLNTAYRFYVGYILLISVLVSYISLKRLGGNDRITGLALCCIYELCGYHFMMLHGAQLGMDSAYAFLPAVFLFLRKILSGELDGWKGLCLSLTCIIQSHVLTTAMAGFFILAACVVFIRKTLTGRVFLTLWKTLIFTVLLNLFYLVPLADSLIRQRFNGSFEVFLWENTAPLTQLLTYNFNLQAFRINGIAGGGIALLILVLTILYTGVMSFCTETAGKETASKEIAGLLFLLLLALYLTCNSRFYYNIYCISDVLYKACSVLQFPWRFNSMVMVLAVCTGALSLRVLRDKIADKTLLLLLILMVSVSISQASSLLARMSGFDSVVSVYDGTGFGKTRIYEFDIKDSDLDRTYSERDIETGSDYISADIIRQKGVSLTADINNATGHDSVILIPRWNYEGYTAVADNGSRLDVRNGENNRAAVTIPANYKGTIQVYYHEPVLWRISEIISAAALLAILAEMKHGNKILSRFGKRFSK